MTNLQPDEIIDITITGARVVRNGQDELGRAFVEYTHGEYNLVATVDRDDPAVNVVRIAPAEWPPKPGDLWRDQSGRLWMHQSYYVSAGDMGGYTTKQMVRADGHENYEDLAYFLQERGPLTLAYREGMTS